MPHKILLMGASYGSLLASKLLFGGHSIHLVCLPAEADLINAEGFKVKLPVRGRSEPVLLGTALDPQGEGGGVNWDNPQTGAKGKFTPVGLAYPTDGKICRAFLAEVATREQSERLQGTACRERTVEWTLTEVRPWRKG